MVNGDAKVLYVGPDHCIALHRNLLIAVALDDPRPNFTQLLPGFLERLQRQAKGPYGFMVVLPPENPPPKEQARETIKKAFHQFGEVCTFGAMALEMTGFLAAGQRSVINLIMLAVRPSFSMKVFGTVDEASRFVVEKQAREPQQTVGELNAVVERLKTGYRAGTLRAAI